MREKSSIPIMIDEKEMFCYNDCMKVYRVCKENEFREIMRSRGFCKVGKAFENNEKLNNHKYVTGKKYLHFFKDISGILYVNSSSGNYICTYEIPDEILRDKIGYGKYLDYVNFKTLNLVPEYAIETELLEFEFLLKIDKIVKDIDYRDLFFNPYFKGLTENVYDESNSNELGLD